MPRELTGYKVNNADDGLTITARDEPGHDGACHHYGIRWEDNSHNAELWCLIDFQNGTPSKIGVNGVTDEALLAILIDRLRCLRSGPLASTEKVMALQLLETALDALKLPPVEPFWKHTDPKPTTEEKS